MKTWQIGICAGFLSDILKKGIDENFFREDINMGLVHDIIYGTYDFEAISCLTIREIDKGSSDLDDIVIILRAILSRPKEMNNVAFTEKRILKAAEDQFADHGYAKAKISDIAKRAGVSDITIYDYFKNNCYSVQVSFFFDFSCLVNILIIFSCPFMM